MTMLQVFLLLSLWTAAPVAGLTIGTPSSCGSASNIQVTALGASCDGGTCDAGDEVTATGTITLSGLSSSTVYATVKASVMYGSLHYTFYNDKEVDVCGGLESSSGSDCPADGTYTFEESYQLPDQLPSNWFMRNTPVVIKASFTDGSTSLGCSKTKITMSNSSGGYSMSASLVSVSVVGLAVSSFFFRRYKLKTRKEPTLSIGTDYKMADGALV